MSVKILVKTIYEVLPVVDRTFRPSTFITPPTTVQIPVTGNNVVSCNNKQLQITYTVSQSEINAEKDRLNELFPSLNWAHSDNSEGRAGAGDQLFKYGGHYTSLSNDFSSAYISSKKFIVYPATSTTSAKDMLLFVTEYYIRPQEFFPAPKDILKTKKIKDVFTDLDSKKLKIKFKNIPRKLRDIDPSQYNKYSFDYRGNLVPNGKSTSTINVVENNFQCWECVDTSGNLVKELPPYFIASNEMRYRAFFGSVDGIENKNTDLTDSKQDWEWIPYEYYKNNCSLSIDDRRIAHGGFGGFGTDGAPVFRIKGDTIYIATEIETINDLFDYQSYKTKISEYEIKQLDKVKNFPWVRKLDINTTVPGLFGIPYATLDTVPNSDAVGCVNFNLCEISCIPGLNGDGTISDNDISDLSLPFLREDYFLEKVYDKVQNKFVKIVKVTKYITVKCTKEVIDLYLRWKVTDPATFGESDVCGILDPDTLEWNVNLEDVVTQSIRETDRYKSSKANRLSVSFSYPYISNTIPALPGNTIGLKLVKRGLYVSFCPEPSPWLRSIRIVTESKSCLGIKTPCEDPTIFHRTFDWAGNQSGGTNISLPDGKNVKLLYHNSRLSSKIPSIEQQITNCDPCIMNLSNVTLCGETAEITSLGTCKDPLLNGAEREIT